MTNADLIEKIRAIGGIPNTEVLGARDEDLLARADESLTTHLLPKLLELRENYYVRRQRTALTPGVTRYRLPARASLNKLHGLFIVRDDVFQEIDEIDYEELNEIQTQADGHPAGYLLEGNTILLVPENGSYTGSLQFAFYARPGLLLLPDDVRQITDITGDEVTLDADAPTAWAPGLFDAHSAQSGAELSLWDATVSDITDDVLTFTDPIDGSTFGTSPLQVGDYIVPAGFSALPCLPAELHGLLARAACLQLAESLGDTTKIQVHAGLLDKAFKSMGSAMETRIDTKPIKLGRNTTLKRRLRFR